jgi:excinuclease ABC subunit C
MIKKINLSAKDLDIFQSISDRVIYARNNFEQNQDAINQLMEHGRQNALVYLQRQALGQRLNLFEENNLFTSVVAIQKTLGLKKIPRRIECYDISHLQGKFVYGSMVTFLDGRSSKKFYRLFKCPDKNNDFENHQEVLTRRFNRYFKNPEDKGWQLPDLIIVDGGKGQLSADYQILNSFGLRDKVEMIALAKREEEVFLPEMEGFDSKDFKLGEQGGILLTGNAKFLVQRIRDEAHRFAITNNRNARLKTANKSILDDLPGVGKTTKDKILKTFQSYPNFLKALEFNRELVMELIGVKLTFKLRSHFGIK